MKLMRLNQTKIGELVERIASERPESAVMDGWEV
jgi:hypothetical protein